MNNTNDVKNINISSVLQCVQKNGAISKGNIASSLGITTVTSHKLVDELCKYGFCVTSGEYVSYGGKKAALYKTNADFGLLIGITVGRDNCQILLCDFELSIIKKTSFSIDFADVDLTLKSIFKNLKKIIAFAHGKRILGIGISVPGRADKSGNLIDIPDFSQWNGVALGEIFSREFNLPVYVDNDANALALSVKWHGEAASYSNFACVQIKNGIGVGLVFNHEIFYGAGFHGSEFGHITVSPDGETCSCGRRGCLQTFVSEKRVLDSLRKIYDESLSFEQAVELYKIGDRNARREFEDYIKYLRLTVDNVITTFDPEAVFLYNDLAASVKDFKKQLQNSFFETAAKRPLVELISDKNIISTASACILYEEIMKKPMSFAEE